ncbi:MAG: hypothetical protein F6K31_28360 [Symploca sp. SIO2G7]|nr:hypothetical protein [Symploca sp. SIO2G7]
MTTPAHNTQKKAMNYFIDASSQAKTFEEFSQANISHTCQPLFYYLQNEASEWMVENFGSFLEKLPAIHKYMILSAIAIKGMEESEQGDQYSMPEIFQSNSYSFDDEDYNECDYNEDMIEALNVCSTQELLQLSIFLAENLQDYAE